MVEVIQKLIVRKKVQLAKVQAELRDLEELRAKVEAVPPVKGK